MLSKNFLFKGAFFGREKRVKFSERWRQLLEVEPANGQPQSAPSRHLQEFLNSGLSDITKDQEYAAAANSQQHATTTTTGTDTAAAAAAPPSTTSGSLYEINTSRPGVPSPYVDLYASAHLTDEEIRAELAHFHSHLDELSAVLTLGLASVRSYANLYVVEPTHEITMCCRCTTTTTTATTTNNNLDTYDRLKPIASMHERFLREHFTRKLEVRRNLKLMSIVAFLVPLLAGLKRRMKIPDLNNLLPLITGEDVRTERELPPLMLGADFRSQLFAQPSTNNDSSSSASHHHHPTGSAATERSAHTNNNNKKYFNLHGGIQFEVDTCSIENNCHK